MHWAQKKCVRILKNLSKSQLVMYLLIPMQVYQMQWENTMNNLKKQHISLKIGQKKVL